MAKTDTERETLAEAQRDYEEDRRCHDAWVEKVDRWWRAYEGMVEIGSEADSWRHDYRPRYALQIIETLAAGVLDPNPTWKVRAKQRMTSQEELRSIREGARALEILLAAQRDTDQMISKQRDHRLQGLIAGMSVWKTRWSLQERIVPERYSYEDEFGYPLEGIREIAKPTEDDPSVECVDVRDFILHEAAKNIQSAIRLHHRVFMSWDDLQEMKRRGVYRNVDKLSEQRNRSSADLANREGGPHPYDRTKDLIEVVESWRDGGKRMVVFAPDQGVLLASTDNPFEHGLYPFISCAPIPGRFRPYGVSIVELVEDLQEIHWSFQNQTLDNLELLNNLILKVREGSTFGDPIFAPGEQWLMDDPSAVEPLTLPTFPAEIALSHLNLIKGDIQNIPGASPALLGQAEGQEQTATEVSLQASLAQRRLSAQKFQFTLADKMVAEQWIELNKQFLTEDRYVAIVGEDGEEGWQTIHPDDFVHHDWRVEVEQMDESLLRQERLAEAQARFQVFVQAAPVFASIGTPLNLKAAAEDVLVAAGIQDTDRYFASQPQPVMGQGQQPGQQNGNGNGVTNPQLAAGPMSPSNANSLSPASMMQQYLAGNDPVNA